MSRHCHHHTFFLVLLWLAFPVQWSACLKSLNVKYHLRKQRIKWKKKNISSWRYVCSPKNAYNLFSQQKYTLFGGLQTWTIEKYFYGTSTKKYWTLVGTVTNYTKYSHIWKLCLWHPFNDNHTYFILSNNQIGIFCAGVNTVVPWYLRGTGSMTPANKNNPQGHIIFQGRGLMCPPLLGKVRKLAFSTLPPKNPYYSFVF